MHRFYLTRKSIESGGLVLRQAEAHHCAEVLRLREGERVVVFDGEGHEYLCKIAQVAKGEIRLSETQKQTVPPLPFRVTLAQALPKGKIMDTIVQKATELGVHRIIPVASERTVVRIDEADDQGERADRKRERWQDIAIEAAKQSGNNWLPSVEAVQSVKQLAGEIRHFDLAVVGSLQPGSKFLKFHLDDYVAERRKLPASVLVCIGPEGDYTPAEISLLEGAGCRPITLGQIVLRSETAAVYSIATLVYELQTRRPVGQ